MVCLNSFLYIEMRVYKKLTVRGPIKIPTGPKREIPPRTEKRINKEDIFIFLLTITGPKRLSIVPTIRIAHIRRPMADAVCPSINRKITAGIEIREVPSVGISEVIAATTPQRALF